MAGQVTYTELHHQMMDQGYIPRGPYTLPELTNPQGLQLMIGNLKLQKTDIAELRIVAGGLLRSDMEDLPSLYMVYILPRKRVDEAQRERTTIDETVSTASPHMPVFGNRRKAELGIPPMH